MDSFQTFLIHAGGGIGWSRDTTFRDQDCNSPNAFFACDLVSPGDFGHSGAIINLGASTPLGGPIRGAIEIFHGNNFDFNGSVVDIAGIPGFGNERFHADVQFSKLEKWLYVDVNKLIVLPSFIQPLVGAGAGISRNRLASVQSNFAVGRFDATASPPRGSQTNFVWGVAAGAGIPLDGPNGPIVELFWLRQDLGRVRSGAGEADLHGADPEGPFSTTLPVDPVQADLVNDTFMARLRFPLNNIGSIFVGD